MAEQHALITGPITGRIPIKHEAHPDGWVNVSPDVLMFDSLDALHVVKDAIEDEHIARGTHPKDETGAI